MPLSHEVVTTADPLEMIELFAENGWTDGLPIVPPTAEHVGAMLATVERDPDEVVLEVPEAGRSVTIALAAINAVMAGCSQECFPVVVATLDAWADPRWGAGNRNYFYIGLASTGGAGQLQIVNGPIRNSLRMNSGLNLYGPGNRANATIGRAMRLIAINGIGMKVGELEMATQGHPGKYSYCFAENEEESPWEPLHVEYGFDASESTVFAMSARGPEAVENRHSNAPEEILLTIADTMSRIGGQLGINARWGGQPILVVMGPEHAQKIAKRGWSKRDAKTFLAANAKRPVEDVMRLNVRSDDDFVTDNGEPVGDEAHVVDDPDDIHIVVAGGNNAGISSVITSWANYIRRNSPIITPIRPAS